MNKLTKAAKTELEYLNEIIAKVEKALDNAPSGTLKIERKHGQIYYYRRLGGSNEKKVYIPKNNSALAADLAQKGYDTKLLKNLYARRKALEKFLKGYPPETLDSIYEGLCRERQKLITPVVLTDSQYTAAWLDKPYAGLSFREDDKSRFFTDKGERVRSKSEIIIANTLARYNIPYKYECPLTLGGRTIYPDFTILDIKRRSIVYLEHFGRMDDPEYANDFVRKMNFYESNKIFPGDGLIMTFESSRIALDTAVADLLIENCLL